MVLPTGYDPSQLAPRLLVHDVAGTLQYTYEAKQIAASPVQNFKLSTISLHLSVNDDFGYLDFLIEDPDNQLTDTDARATPLIGQQWPVQLYLGKSSSSLNRWFYGIISDVQVIRPRTALQQIRVHCDGWGIKTQYRMTNIKRFQDKQANGVDLDSADTNTRVSELAKDVVQDDDHYIDSGLTTESEITVNGVQTIDVKLADFQQTAQTWFSAISQLAAYSNCYWGLDGDRDLYMIEQGSTDGGFLFSNNLTGLDVVGWDKDKLGLLRNSSFAWNDTTYVGGISILHGLGANVVTKDQEQDPTPDNFLNMDANWVAVKFTPGQENLEKIALSLIRTGTPASGDASFFVVGDDGTGKPNLLDLRAKGTLGQSVLQALPTIGKNYVEIAFNIKGGIRVSPREELFIAVKKYGTASHTLQH